MLTIEKKNLINVSHILFNNMKTNIFLVPFSTSEIKIRENDSLLKEYFTSKEKGKKKRKRRDQW